MVVQPEPEVLDKRDLEDMLETEAARLAANGQRFDSGTLYRFYEEQREKKGFKPTITQRTISTLIKRWNKKGGPRPRTDLRNRIDGGEF
jgi:hypothetical protein